MSTIEFDLGIVGDGQLGMMITEAAHDEGLRVAVVGDGPNSPAAQVGAEVIMGGIRDEKAIAQLALLSSVVTIEVEHINGAAYQHAEERYGNTQPKPETLLTIYDKLDQKRFLASHGIPVAPFSDRLDEAEFPTVPDFESDELNRFVIKSRMGGFDGRGNLSVASLTDPRIAPMAEKSAVYVEQMLPFNKELSVVVARDVNGAIVPYPVVETIHKDHICHTVISSDALDSAIASRAQAIAVEAVRHFSGAGVFAVELFVVGNYIIVNEIAPRVHNSGHLTIEANETSQFKQQVLAVTGQELGPTDRLAPAAVMVNILHAYDDDGMRLVQKMPDTYVHMYGKEPREGQPRKIGHLTILAHDVNTALERAGQAQQLLEIEE